MNMNPYAQNPNRSSAANGPGYDYPQFRLEASNRGMWLPLNTMLPYQQMQGFMQGMNQNGNMNANAMSARMPNPNLQEYINRNTQNASDALYGGLLNYSPRSLIAGNAGGTPQNSSVPNFNIPAGLLNASFGQRSWMK
jgi:hypothetical protein